MAKFPMARTLLMTTAILTMVACSDEESAKPAAKRPTPKPATDFNVGGSVSGLSGSGLVLQINGANDLQVNADGKFNFNKRLSKGNAYAVTVKTSPSTPVKQTCAVNQGSGTITGAIVNNVAVICTTNSFAVGGKVSGLSGKGLSLQLNGTHDIAIEKNGNFVFPNVLLPDASDYSVAIKTMPVKQMCTIKPVNTAQDKETINIVEVVCSKKGTKK